MTDGPDSLWFGAEERLTPEEYAYKQRLKQFERIVEAEKAPPSAHRAALLAQAQKRLGAAAQRKAAFERAYPEPKKVVSKTTIALGAAVAGVLGFFAWKKWGKK